MRTAATTHFRQPWVVVVVVVVRGRVLKNLFECKGSGQSTDDKLSDLVFVNVAPSN